jgi:hypothetical protein
LPAGWNEVAATVGEVLFLGESQTCHVVTGGTELTVKALSAAGMPMRAGIRSRCGGRWRMPVFIPNGRRVI